MNPFVYTVFKVMNHDDMTSTHCQQFMKSSQVIIVSHNNTIQSSIEPICHATAAILNSIRICFFVIRYCYCNSSLTFALHTFIYNTYILQDVKRPYHTQNPRFYCVSHLTKVQKKETLNI